MGELPKNGALDGFNTPLLGKIKGTMRKVRPPGRRRHRESPKALHAPRRGVLGYPRQCSRLPAGARLTQGVSPRGT